MVGTAAGLWLKREGFLWTAVKLAAITALTIWWVRFRFVRDLDDWVPRLAAMEAPVVAVCGFFAARGVLASRYGVSRLRDLDPSAEETSEWISSLILPLRCILVGQAVVFHAAGIAYMMTLPPESFSVPISYVLALPYSALLGFAIPGFVANRMLQAEHRIYHLIEGAVLAGVLAMLGSLAYFEGSVDQRSCFAGDPLLGPIAIVAFALMAWSALVGTARIKESTTRYLARLAT